MPDPTVTAVLIAKFDELVAMTARDLEGSRRRSTATPRSTC
jgi:hypothetical protein